MELTAKLQKQKTLLASFRERGPFWENDTQQPPPHKHESPVPRFWVRKWGIHLSSEVRSCVNSTHQTPNPNLIPTTHQNKVPNLPQRGRKNIWNQKAHSISFPPEPGRALKPQPSAVLGHDQSAQLKARRRRHLLQAHRSWIFSLLPKATKNSERLSALRMSH